MENLIIKYFQGELSEKERLTLFQAIETDSTLKELYLAYQKLYTIVQLADQHTDTAEGRKSYQQFINKKRIQRTKKYFIKTLQYAAMIIAIVSATWMLSTTHNESQEMLTKLYVPAGQRAQLTLSDGTEVWLNAQSTLIYPTTFSSKDRRVKLVGEAFFKVTKNINKPFIVSSKDIELKVLGTAFNVYSYPEIEGVEASLLEGSLQVYEINHQNNAVILKPNEQISCVNGKMNVSSFSDIESLKWKEGIYTFNNVAFSDIIKKLELYYDVKIIVQEELIKNFRYTGKFRQRDGIDEILRIIQKIHKFKIRKSEDGGQIWLR